MNTSLRRVAMTLMVLVVLLLANATLTQVFAADGLRADPRNQRVLLDEYSRQRGQITASGQLLAYSVTTDDRIRYQRVYAKPDVYAPITGFYSLRFSSSGLERAEDLVLNGSDPRLFGSRLADFFTGREPRGGNVETTVNPRVQQAGWDAMQRGCDGGCRGAVVALEPTTGKILALVSAPSYDPNLLSSHDPEAQGGAWQRLRDDKHSPLTDRAIAETYPPGSTFKIITTAAALQAGVSEGEQLTAAPQIALPDSTVTVQNFGGAACDSTDPTVSLRVAFARSCNTAFVELGIRTGVDALRETARAFGLDHVPDPIPLQVAQSTIGPISDTAALGMSSIGQRDVAVTPLNNALIAATIANRGMMMQPYLVDSLEGPDLVGIATTAPRQQRRAVTPQVAAKLTELMIGAEKATQQEGAIPGVQIASKTGTAEHGSDPRHTPPHAWYIAFAPAVGPKVAVAVLVEGSKDGGSLSATGGAVAAPIGRAVIAAALQGES
ncbi:MAG TPA: D,D-transpeptidase PbpA [Mycobacterium sp.]|nr:D,D-transpeptidase PbpA [Mycobacterium sp.]